MSSTIRTNPQQDLLNQWHIFLRNSTSKTDSYYLDVCKVAIPVLKYLPSSRFAVFEYFDRIFDNAALQYVKGTQGNSKEERVVASSADETVTDIGAVLVKLVTDNSIYWAPVVCKWSLNLLGEISAKYSGKFQVHASLNETLQLWTNCCSTRTLLDINTTCLSSLMNSDADSCISELLEASVKYSPFFDWFVVHVGSCFPDIVISRILNCGLKDFSRNKSYEQSVESGKLKSVVGILDHLASTHSSQIRGSILEIFRWSINGHMSDDSAVKNRKKAAVPFILQLSFLSSSLLKAIFQDMRSTINLDVISKMVPFVEDWARYFGSGEAFEKFLTSLVMRSETGGVQIIRLVLDCIFNNDCKESHILLRIKCQELLENILIELEDSVRHKEHITFLDTLSSEEEELQKMLISSVETNQKIAARIISFVGSNSPNILMQSLIYLFKNIQLPSHQKLLLKLLTNELTDKTVVPCSEPGGHFGVILEEVITRDMQRCLFFSKVENDAWVLIWKNLLTFLRWEKTKALHILKYQFITRGIQVNLEKCMIEFSNDLCLLHILTDILDTLEFPHSNKFYVPSIEVVLNLTNILVNYFFLCCTEQSHILKYKGFQKVNRILKRLCAYYKAARTLAIRELLDRALFRNDNVLFGAKHYSFQNNHDCDKLLKQNNKINKTIPLTKHSSVFNGGIIGNGKRKHVKTNEVPTEIVTENIEELLLVVRSCCTNNENDNKYSELSLDDVTYVSLLLVQFVSSNVMYNGLPWPEEEFSKVTVERDLLIRRLFNNYPLLWELLTFVAQNRPSLCYCSVLIRALTATLIHQWRSIGEQTKLTAPKQYHLLMTTTIRIIDIMALGQLLPPPLSEIRNILPYLKCFEIVAILRDCIWCYVRDHIPSPALFNVDDNDVHWRDPVLARPSSMYTDCLRIIMQRNMKVLGKKYSQMFINIPKPE